ncbi:peptidyl-alpha-hydroxyglycine alpha-amidating lyase 1 [Trichonephila inaurata madagascariensis]|uniref:Peptidyl-alpha-hydroxyglycine alpha-amidating lyase 1 n=1 Tax=Trichonephila inaurata madagascariensis TaxID=2747483 RepID=A0A8X6Y0B2_9ARAC|nr:peptidyl-alpha-hydroxyglycine alpha-amidating lyase 1 [Trichonephila inaurata madagascariensis]
MAVSAAALVLGLAISITYSKTLTGSEKNLIEFLDEKPENGPRVREDVSWPGFPYLKQVSAVSVDGNGNLHVFHRGDRVWDAHTFDRTYRLKDTEQGPIPNDTVLVIDTSNGKILYSWGANKFYMPHGLTVDHFGNTWVTDVGLHQSKTEERVGCGVVFNDPIISFTLHNSMSVSSAELTAILVVLQHILVSSYRHFCVYTDSMSALESLHSLTERGHPTVMEILLLLRKLERKDFDIIFSWVPGHVGILGNERADNAARSMTDHMQRPVYGMVVPHSLTLVPEHDAVCVADRENGRVLCYATGMDGSEPGTPLASIENQGLGRVFAIDARGKQLFLVNGPDLWQNSQSVSSDHGLVLDIESGLPMTLWGPDKGFRLPHDLAVSPDGKYVYVSEIDLSAPKRVYKFNIRN